MVGFEDDLLALLPRLRRFARSLARDAADADDLCQVTVEKALVARSSWQPGTRMDSWMYRIMRNSWIDATRARSRAGQTFVDEAAGFDIGNDGNAEARVAVNEVEAAMRTLPDEQREAIALVLVEGFAYKEAADVLDIPIGTLTSRLVRGRQALMARLGEAAMTIDPEQLMAYADGELDPLAAKRVERAIADDPALAAQIAQHRALRARVAGTFAGVAEEPVPDRLAALLRSNVVPLPPPRGAPTRRHWSIAVAIAASAIFGLSLGLMMQSDPVVTRNGALYASGTLAGALDAKRGEGDPAVRIAVTFRERSGAYCRVFAASSTDGIACHDDRGWALRWTQRGADAVSQSGYAQAGSADADLMAAAQDMMAGAPLDATEEEKARQASWR